MGKYQGKDGWLHDDSVDGTSRYKKSESTQKPKQPPKPKKKHDRCPNCSMSHCWRREEGYCTSCGWGKTESAKKEDNDGGIYCCFAAAALIILPLLGTGMGYGFGGFGGMIAGFAIGLAVPVVVMAYAVSTAPKKKGQQK